MGKGIRSGRRFDVRKGTEVDEMGTRVWEVDSEKGWSSRSRLNGATDVNLLADGPQLTRRGPRLCFGDILGSVSRIWRIRIDARLWNIVIFGG
jgi:hypothetical protein